MGTTDWHIAQLNVATAVAPLDSPALADFMALLDDVNALAEASPGFIWRLTGDGDDATSIRAGDDPKFIVNMSVWRSVEALFEFVYRSMHTKVMSRRREWFGKPDQAYQVLWWVPAGHHPSLEEALARLDHLRAHGPSAHAFTFKDRYPPPDTAGDPVDMQPEPYCVGWA
jgi:hypothetical protein